MKFSSSFHLPSNDAAADGCLTGILRRFLCRSVRSDDCGEGEEGHGIDDGGFGREWKVEQKIIPSPGIVARLMGLESMPVYPSAASGLVGRSWSTNSLESWSGFRCESRRSPEFRTSRSSREVPTYLRQENEDFLLLSFTPDDGEEGMASNGTRRRMELRETKERKKREDKAGVEKESRTLRIFREKKKNTKSFEQQHCRKENLTEKKHGEVRGSAVRRSRRKDVHSKDCHSTEAAVSINPINYREMPIMLDRSNIVKKKLQSAQEKVEPECSSQNSSPVSVLDLPGIDDDRWIDTNSPSTRQGKKLIQQSSRKKLSLKCGNVYCLTPSIGLVTFSRDGALRSLQKESKRSRNQEQTSPDFSDIWGKICRLAEEDLKNHTWISKETSRLERVGDVAADLGLDILDLLLYEVVCELPNYITP